MYVMYCESLMFPERSSLSRVVHRYGERFVHLETFRSTIAFLREYCCDLSILNESRYRCATGCRFSGLALSYDLFALRSTRQRYFCACERDDAWTRFFGRVEYRGSSRRSAKPRGNCASVRPSCSLARKTFERLSAASMFSR